MYVGNNDVICYVLVLLLLLLLLLLSIGFRRLMPRMYLRHLAYCTTLRRYRSHR